MIVVAMATRKAEGLIQDKHVSRKAVNIRSERSESIVSVQIKDENLNHMSYPPINFSESRTILCIENLTKIRRLLFSTERSYTLSSRNFFINCACSELKFECQHCGNKSIIDTSFRISIMVSIQDIHENLLRSNLDFFFDLDYIFIICYLNSFSD